MTVTDEPTFTDVVTPQQPAANDQQRALLEWAAANPTDRPTPNRAANGRYKLPDPVTGKNKTWTRATTWASTIDDSAGLTTWRNRLLVAGILGNHSDFADTALDDKTALSSVASRALHLAGEKLAADIGTALHTAIEHHCTGRPDAPRPPEPWAADVDAFARLLEQHQLTVDPALVERILLTPAIECAGTSDFVVTRPDGTHAIADLKTGSGAERLAYAVQLATYARATHMWALDGTGYEPMPTVDQTVAYIVHVPAGSGTATLVEVDIAKGWELALLCGQVREARKAKALFTNLVPDTLEADLEASLPIEDRTAWLIARKDDLKANNPEMVPAAIAAWQTTGISFQPPWTHTEIDTLSELLHGVEQAWPANDPTTPAPVIATEPATPPGLPDVTEDSPPADTEHIDGLKATIRGLAEADHKVAMLTHWARQGTAGNRPWDSTAGMTVRCWTIARATVRFLVCIGADDKRLRMALAYILGDDLHETWSTGAVLGSLTTAQAEELAQVADAYRAKDATVRAVIDAA